MNPVVYILLPVHNRRVTTARFIESLVMQTYKNYNLILIDDGSTDNTDEMVKKRISNLSIIRGEGNWWWAGSLQKGIDWLKKNNVSDEDMILFMNDDVLLEKDFLEKAVKILKKTEGLILPQDIEKSTGKIIESGVEADLKNLVFKIAPSPERINCLPTRGLFMRMGDLRTIGNFYPYLLPHYLSDYEFTIRARKKGLKLSTSPELFIRYDENETGFHEFKKMPFNEFLKKYFSKKSATNPFYWTSFILLASPILYIPRQLALLWYRVLKLLVKRALFD